MIGNGLSAVAIPWFVYDLTGSALATSGVILAGQIPNIVTGILAGPLIDRFSAKAVSLACDAVNAVAIVLIPLFFSIGLLEIGLLAALVFLSQVIDIPGQTAKQVLVPHLIEKNGLPREKVNGFYSLVETGSDLAAPLLAGMLISLLGALFVLAIDSATFLAAVVLLGLGIRKSAPAKDGTPWIPLLETWRRLTQEKRILRLGVYDLIINAVATSLLSLVLPVIANATGEGAGWLGLWLAFFALGATTTTATYIFLGHRLSHIRVLQLTPLGQALGLLLVASALYMGTSSVVVALGMFIFGVNLGVGSVVDAKLLQELVPAQRRGTVFSAFSAMRFVGVPIGLLVSGLLLEQELYVVLLLIFAAAVGITSLIWVNESAT